MLQGKYRKVGDADPGFDEPMFVVAHDLRQFERAIPGKIEVLHLLEKRPFMAGHQGQQPRDVFAAESEIHGVIPYRQSNSAMASRLRKCPGTISTPLIEIPKVLSSVATIVIMSNESSIPSAMKSWDAVKSDSGRIPLNSSVSEFIGSVCSFSFGMTAGQNIRLARRCRSILPMGFLGIRSMR